ncbi:hypothetical protein SADUNF_Sadunf04G0021700 [Salix dunnii]|uniref:Uncharacterized protein n=1 Tax=Salix dunnii TaxID=1413687 RepID=A0A835K6I3_9ROSI|nr:hypothetical protein SADUNF_Sadunf04G0021700 [Salix dunnii]
MTTASIHFIFSYISSFSAKSEWEKKEKTLHVIQSRVSLPCKDPLLSPPLLLHQREFIISFKLILMLGHCSLRVSRSLLQSSTDIRFI